MPVETRETKEAKAGRIQDLYKAPSTITDKREKLARGVLPDLNKAEQKGKRPHPADQDILEWMRAERKRAEEHAEKRWRAKFQDMVRSPQQSTELHETPEEQSRANTGNSAPAPVNFARTDSFASMRRSMSMMSLGGTRGSLVGTEALVQEGGLGRYQIEELQRLRAQADDFKKSKKQLAIEQRFRAELEHKLLLTTAELEEARARCEEAEKQLRIFKNMHAAQRLAEIERLVEGIGTEGQWRTASAESTSRRSKSASKELDIASSERTLSNEGGEAEVCAATDAPLSPAAPPAEKPGLSNSAAHESVVESPEKDAPTPAQTVMESPTPSRDGQVEASPEGELYSPSVQQKEATGSLPAAASGEGEAATAANSPQLVAKSEEGKSEAASPASSPQVADKSEEAAAASLPPPVAPPQPPEQAQQPQGEEGGGERAGLDAAEPPTRAS